MQGLLSSELGVYFSDFDDIARDDPVMVAS